MIPSTLLEGPLFETSQAGISLEKGKGVSANGFADLLGRMTESDGNVSTENIFEKQAPSGHSFLSQFKRAIMASGRSLESYKVDADTMSEFGSILVKLGFDADEVKEMLSNLSARNINKNVSLADLFKGASQLTEPENDGRRPVMLDLSAQGELESILCELGLAPEASQRIIADAIIEGGGIELRTLAAGIRRAISAVPAGFEARIESQGEMMERLRLLGLSGNEEMFAQATLDQLINEVAQFNDAQALLKESGEAGGLPGRLLATYLQKLVAPLGSEGRDLRRLIASAGKDDGGFDGDGLLSKLVQMKHRAASASGVSDLQSGAGADAGRADAGKMSLSRFVTILENRIAAEEGLQGGVKTTHAARSMAETAGEFMKNISPDAENTPKRQRILPVDAESGRRFETPWQPGTKRAVDSNSSRSTGRTILETAPKEVGGQNAAQVSRQTAMFGEQDRSLSENAAGREQSEKLSHLLNAAGRDKTEKTGDEARIGAEALARGTKLHDDGTFVLKTTAGRNLPGYLLNQVSRQIIRLRNAGENELTLQLKPPHLGRMKLNIEQTAGGIKVGIVVESHAAKELLLANANDLKASLADQGLRLEKIEVEAQADFGQSMAQAGRGFGRSGDQKGRWVGRSRSDGGSDSEAPSVNEAVLRGGNSGRLYLVA